MAFTSLITATAADWQHVIAEEAAIPHARHVHDLLMMLLTQQRDDECYGPPINGYQHCLQTTTRALQGGEPVLLSAEEMAKVGARYGNYGVGLLPG